MGDSLNLGASQKNFLGYIKKRDNVLIISFSNGCEEAKYINTSDQNYFINDLISLFCMFNTSVGDLPRPSS
jgi:hypothetical protein